MTSEGRAHAIRCPNYFSAVSISTKIDKKFYHYSTYIRIHNLELYATEILEIPVVTLEFCVALIAHESIIVDTVETSIALAHHTARFADFVSWSSSSTPL